MMKKNFHSFILLLLLGLTACVEPLQPNVPMPEVQEDFEGAPVRLNFAVAGGGVATKALGDTPDIQTLHVFLFNPYGALIAAEKAELKGKVKVNGSGDNHVDYPNAQAWTVNLPMGTAERHLHFIANLGDDYTPPASGSEASLIHAITTTGGADAYWQYINLPDETGIGAYQYDGTGYWTYVNDEDGKTYTDPVSKVGGYIDGSISGESPNISYQYYDSETEVTYTVNRGDYIDISGHKIIDGNGMYASEATSEKISIVPLIRNFARIKVICKDGSNFVVNKAALINVPVAGFAAPYDEVNHTFVEPYTKEYMFSHLVSGQEYTPDREAVSSSGYLAQIPADGIDTSCPEEPSVNPSAYTTAVDGTVTLFMYERNIPEEDATSILVCGDYTDENHVVHQNRWFKIEIAGSDGSYFPIYRDFEYVIEISGINGTTGYDTAAKAYENAAVGDLSSSPETKTLTRIDDGKGLSIWVSYIDYVSTSSTQTELKLLYKFVYTDPATSTVTDLGNPTDGNVTLSLVSHSGYNAAVTNYTNPVAYSGAASGTPDGTGQYWYSTTVTLDGSGSSVKLSDIHVEGVYSRESGGIVSYRKALARDVSYHVMPKQDFKLHTTGLTGGGTSSTAGGYRDTTTLQITLPANVLGYSMFPLYLEIESSKNNLNPFITADINDNLSVESGASAFVPTQNLFYFLKVVSYDEYMQPGGNVITVTLKTTKTINNDCWVAVTDKAGNFNDAFVKLRTGVASDQEAYDSSWPTN